MIYATPLPILRRLIDSRHFAELIAYDRSYGLPDPWLQTGVIASAAANAFGGKTKAADFMPQKKREPMNSTQQMALLASMAKKKVKRGDNR